jgi:RNA polymerase sigma factor (sigma-70 family)
MVAATLADQSDRQLVERFLAGQDEAVLEAIVRRHGAMVYRVCWRVLQHHHDAEDAFQATFLVLAQRLRTVRKHASLASWLHGVAHRVALKSKAEAATRRRHEQQAAVSPPVPPDDVSWGEVRAVLDAELVGLPEKWRLPLVLCYLEGRTQDEAAAQLGWSPRTLRRRLEEARTGLGRRLSRRGVAWSAALSAVLLSESGASAALSPGLLDSTIKAASLFAAGQTAAAVLISAKAAALTEGVLKTMFLSKLKIAVVAFLVIGTLGIGISAQTRRTLAADSPPAASKSAPPSQEEGEPDKAGKLAGEWFYDSKVDQPCAISQHGRVLLLVNEEGELATARLTEARNFVVLREYGGWGEEGLVGKLDKKGKTISWSNGTTWKRP